ncbi:unnamed protein product [Oikopleura dioica]|uniref:Uncharacterized protein n=1 Tax=Oikopleura dioica TaxID=34765 RepID=E4XEY1_OIKDI|nr:unnamed protein product [Oikopleura dioica]
MTNNTPIQIRAENGQMKFYNLRRHMKLNHDPEKRKKREEEKRTKLKSPSVEYFFRPAKQHTKGEKKEAAALMTSLAAEKYVRAQNQTVTEDSFKSLYPSDYFVGKSVEDNTLEMESFLKKALPQLIAKNLLTISIDDKCIGEKLSDLEKNCHGTLLQIPDPQSGKRVSFLIGFTPTDSKNDETLAELTRNDLRKYGINSDDIIRIIPVIGDAAERGTMTELSLLSVICVCHTLHRVGEMMVDYATAYGFEEIYEYEVQDFLKACTKRIPMAQARSTNSICWSKKAEQFITLYIWKSKIVELENDNAAFHKYLLEDKIIPSWTYVKCQALISVELLSSIRNMESNEACLPDAFFTIENLMIKLANLTKTLQSRDEKNMMNPLAKGAFAKLCNLYFYGFIKDGKEVSRPDPNRSQESNLISTFLFPRPSKHGIDMPRAQPSSYINSFLLMAPKSHPNRFFRKKLQVKKTASMISQISKKESMS